MSNAFTSCSHFMAFFNKKVLIYFPIGHPICDILKQRLMTTLLLTGSFAKIKRENPTFSPLYATNTGVSSAVLRYKISLHLMYSINVWVAPFWGNKNAQPRWIFHMKWQSYKHLNKLWRLLWDISVFPQRWQQRDTTFVKCGLVYKKNPNLLKTDLNHGGLLWLL